jgi:hypothetical protein
MAEWAVLPIENSLGGSIHAVYDLLLRYRLHIVGETSVSVNHCLLALPGTKLSEVTRVLSHPQALAQVDGYLRNLKVGAGARSRGCMCGSGTVGVWDGVSQAGAGVQQRLAREDLARARGTLRGSASSCAAQG